MTWRERLIDVRPLRTSRPSAPAVLVVGGLGAAPAVVTIGLVNRPLRGYRTPPARGPAALG